MIKGIVFNVETEKVSASIDGEHLGEIKFERSGDGVSTITDFTLKEDVEYYLVLEEIFKKTVEVIKSNGDKVEICSDCEKHLVGETNRSLFDLKNVVEFPSVDNKLFDKCIKGFRMTQFYNEFVVNKVFESCENYRFDNIFIEVMVLNDRYSAGLNCNNLSAKTRINNQKNSNDVMTMSYHIYKNCRSEMEKVSQAKNIEAVVGLVNKIRNVNDYMNCCNYFDAYVFATKYCSWKFRNLGIDIPIIDSKVRDLLCIYRDQKIMNCFNFKDSDLNDYKQYVVIYESFVKKIRNDLNKSITYKEVDMFLWQYAKYIEYWYGLSVGR